jgi:SAM-dependent methyltransferase
MSIEGFSHNAQEDLWVADGFTSLGWADGGEAYLQAVLENADAISDYPVELARFIQDWPSRYHLSHLRVNFLEAVRPLLDSTWKALELGGGTGIVTKWLARAVGEVDVLEGSLQRARVNRIRTRDDKNVRVLVGDMVASPYPGKYDLATLIGVLEYTQAQPDTTRRQACLDLLRKIRGSLAENGVLLVAIENRLGAKYWAGCGEDHSARLFDGLVGYPDDTPVTFSRNELETLLREAGFANQQFYHLHPDYKLPTTVIRETDRTDGVSLHQWTLGFGQDYMNPREYLMPDPLLMKGVEDAGLFWHFSNSFLVLCSPSPEAVLAEDWLVKKYSNYSRTELHHTVTLARRGGTLRIERAPIRLGRSPVDLGDYEFKLSDGDYFSGSLLVVEAYAALLSQRWFERLTDLCRQLLEAGRSRFLMETTPRQGSLELFDGAALDFTFWNVMRLGDGSLQFFDTKWTSTRPVPADYVLFRSLLHTLSAGAPFVQEDLREAATRLLRQFFPAFDETRFDTYMERETLLQDCVHADAPSHPSVDERGRLSIPPTGWNTFSKMQRLAAAQARLQGMPEKVARLRDKRAAVKTRLARVRASLRSRSPS